MVCFALDFCPFIKKLKIVSLFLINDKLILIKKNARDEDIEIRTTSYHWKWIGETGRVVARAPDLSTISIDEMLDGHC